MSVDLNRYRPTAFNHIVICIECGSMVSDEVAHTVWHIMLDERQS